MLSALADAVAEEGTVEVAGKVLVRLAGIAVPLASIVVGITQIGADLRAKVRALTAHYERGPLDAMFDFTQEIHDEQQVIDDVLTLLERADNFFENVSLMIK